MQTALLFTLLPFVVLVVGGAVMALAALRNAPEGRETTDGFVFGTEPKPARINPTIQTANLAA